MNKKVIIITGISGDLGTAIGDYFVSEKDWLVIGIDRQNNPRNKEIVFYQCDLTDYNKVESIMSEIFLKYEYANVLINCAGLIFNMPMLSYLDGSIKCHTPGDWSAVIDSNLTSTFYTALFYSKHLFSDRKPGLIINISSICAGGNPGQVAYSAAKSGVNGLTKSMARELAPYGIRVAGLAPGFFDTESTRRNVAENSLRKIKSLTQRSRLGDVCELTHAIDFIIENDFYSGKILELDGGMQL